MGQSRMIGPDDPRRVGGRYWSGYWGEEYEVLSFHTVEDWRERSITVRWQKQPCALHPPPCGFSITTTHATAWDWMWDRIITEPA